MYRQKWCKYIDSVFPYFPQGNVLQEHSGISKPECWQWYSPYLIFICSLVPFFSRAPLPPSIISSKFQVPQTMDLHPHPPPPGRYVLATIFGAGDGALNRDRVPGFRELTFWGGSWKMSVRWFWALLPKESREGSGIRWRIGAARLRRVSGKKGFTWAETEESEGAKPRGLCRETEGPSPRGRVPAVFEE